MSDKVGEYKQRAVEAMKVVEAIMDEARKEGYVVEVYASPDISGNAKSRVSVTLR